MLERYLRHLLILSVSGAVFACKNEGSSTTGAQPQNASVDTISIADAEALFDQAAIPEDDSISPSPKDSNCCGLVCQKAGVPGQESSFFKFFGSDNAPYEKPVRVIASAYDLKTWLEGVTCSPDANQKLWDCKSAVNHVQVRQKGNQFVLKYLKHLSTETNGFYRVCSYTNTYSLKSP